MSANDAHRANFLGSGYAPQDSRPQSGSQFSQFDSRQGAMQAATANSWSREPDRPTNSRTPLLDASREFRQNNTPVLQQHPFISNAMQSGMYQGGPPSGQSSVHATAVPGDGTTIFNPAEVNGHPNQTPGMYSNYNNNIGPQERHSADWHQESLPGNAMPNGYPSQYSSHYPAMQNQNAGYANAQNTHAAGMGALDVYHQFLGGMEGHTRLLQLMHDAFSTQQREAFTEPNGKQKRPLKNFGILD